MVSMDSKATLGPFSNVSVEGSELADGRILPVNLTEQYELISRAQWTPLQLSATPSAHTQEAETGRLKVLGQPGLCETLSQNFFQNQSNGKDKDYRNL